MNTLGIILLVISLLNTLLAVYSIKYRKSPVAIFSLGFLISTVIHSFGYAFELSATNDADVLFWVRIEYIGISFLVIFWVFLVSYLLGKEKVFPNSFKLFCFSLSTFIVLIVFTNNFHGRFFNSISVNYTNNIALMTFVPGPWYWVLHVYVLMMLSLSIFLLLKMLKNAKSYRLQAVMLLFATLLPAASYVLSEILENSEKTRDIELIFNPEVKILSNTINADFNKINQVLENLFRNAVKFTEKGHIEFGMYSNKLGWLSFYISDTGIGIPEEKQPVVFDSFRQANETHCRIHGGLGIGLTISNKITEVLKGTLTFVSKPDVGSTFYLSIPVETIPDLKQTAQEYLAPNLSGKTILVAEDDTQNMNIMRIYLAATNASIIEATNGREVVEKFNQTVNLVLMDLNMPIINGYTATSQIKSIAPDIPVIAISAYALPSDKSKAIEAGCNSIISKPINIELLYAEIFTQINNFALKNSYSASVTHDKNAPKQNAWAMDKNEQFQK